MNDSGMDGSDETREITVEVDEWTARRLEEIAGDYGVGRDELLRRSYRTIVDRADG